MVKTCRQEVLDESYKTRNKKDDSKKLPKIISIMALVILILLIVAKAML